MKVNSIQFPGMRYSLVRGDLKDLSSREYQTKNWVKPEFSHAFWDNFKYAAEDFEIFEDSDRIGFGPKEQIGYQLYSEEEAAWASKISKIFDKIFDKIGCRQPDNAYLDSPYWEELIQAAQNAYAVFSENDKKYEPLVRSLFIEAAGKLTDKNIKEQFKGKNTLKFFEFFKDIVWPLLRVLNYPNLHDSRDYPFWVIKNDEEAGAVEQLRRAIQDFLKDVGDEKAVEDDYISSVSLAEKIQTQPDEFYINSPYFDKMTAAAQNAYAVFSEKSITS